MSLFDSAIDFIITNIEGGHANDPKDPGGDTWYGLARRYHPNEPWPPTRERAIAIYRTDYWDACQADHLPARLACAVVDSAINEGVESAIRILQHTLGLEADGVMGPRTLGAALGRAPGPLTRDFLTRRVMTYTTLKDFGLYGHSWVMRCFQIASFIETLP
jgi:lysozyme family protein